MKTTLFCITLAIVFAFSYVLLSNEKEVWMTPLDKAFIEAQENPGREADFYNLFLNSDLFIPTHDIPKDRKEIRLEKGETISPIIIESQEVQFLMLFNTEERLSAWAKREIGFVRIPGHAVVEMADPSIHWALNVGTEYFKEFVPEEIEWLKSSLEQSKAKEIILERETEVLIGVSTKIPEGLVDSFKRTAARNKEVREAFIAQVYYVKEGEKLHLALVLRLNQASKSVRDAIRDDFVVASRGYFEEGDYIDIHIDDGNGISYEITQAVSPFYKRDK